MDGNTFKKSLKIEQLAQSGHVTGISRKTGSLKEISGKRF